MQDLDIKRHFLEKMRGYGRQGLKDSLAEEDEVLVESDIGPEADLPEGIAGVKRGLGSGSVEDVLAGAKRSLGSGSVEDLGDSSPRPPLTPEEAPPEEEDGIKNGEFPEVDEYHPDQRTELAFLEGDLGEEELEQLRMLLEQQGV